MAEKRLTMPEIEKVAQDLITKVATERNQMHTCPSRETSATLEAVCRVLELRENDAAEISRLRTRLEIPEPPFDNEDTDGISCRNDTISILDEKIVRLTTENKMLADAIVNMTIRLESIEASGAISSFC